VKLLSTAAVWSFAGLFIIPNWIHAQSPLGLGDRNPSTPSQISAAKSEASSEHSFCYDDASLCQADSGPASQTAPPRPAARGVGIGKVGIGVSASTLGSGPQVAVSIAPTLNLRGGASFLIFGHNFTHDGIHYNAHSRFPQWRCASRLVPVSWRFSRERRRFDL
jgi:hypothetical protein